MTPAGKPTATASRSSAPPGWPWKSMCSPCARWCGPQVKAIAIQAAPKWEKPIRPQFRFISIRVIVPYCR